MKFLNASPSALQAIAQALKVAENQIKSCEEWHQVYFVRFTVGRPTFVSKRKTKKEMKKMIEITIDDMRAAGKAGYVAKISSGGDKQFLHPQVRSGHSSSRERLTFKLGEDGIYEVCDANFGSRKRHIYFLKIEGGEQMATADSLAELVAEDLAELEGTPKQIKWATDIRQRTIEQFEAKYIEGYSRHHLEKGRSQVEIDKEIKAFRTAFEQVVLSQLSAKWWIENRDYILNKQVRNQIQEVVNSIPVKA